MTREADPPPRCVLPKPGLSYNRVHFVLKGRLRRDTGLMRADPSGLKPLQYPGLSNQTPQTPSFSCLFRAHAPRDRCAINLRCAGDGRGSRNLAIHHQKSFALVSVAGCMESWMFQPGSSCWRVRITMASRSMPSASMASSSQAKQILR
jgi:hypothetical protein